MLILYLSLWFTFTSPPPESPPLNGSPEPVPPRTVRTAPPPNNASFFVLIGRELFLFSRRTIPCAAASLASAAFAFSLAVTSLEVVAAKDTGHAVAAILTATAALKILLVAFFILCFSSFFWKHLIYPVLCLCHQYRKNNMFFKEAVFDFTLHFLISALYTAME